MCVCVLLQALPPSLAVPIHKHRDTRLCAHTPLWRCSVQLVHVTMEMMNLLYIIMMGSWHSEGAKFMRGTACGAFLCMWVLRGEFTERPWVIKLKIKQSEVIHTPKIQLEVVYRIRCVRVSREHCRKSRTNQTY